MKKILVTGASGFIGRHVVRVLHAAGLQVACLVRTGSNRQGLENTEQIVGDLGDPDSLRRALQGVDGVIHAAAMLKAPWRSNFASTNTIGTAHLAAACAARSTPPALIVVSSLAAAGPAPSGVARSETDPEQPISIYGRVKLDSERAASAYAAQVPITIVRPPMVFGEGDRSALALFRFTQRGWIPLPGHSSHRLSMIHATDLADLLIAALHRGERLGVAVPGHGLYYASADETPTLPELGGLIAAALQKPPPRGVVVPMAVLRLAAAFGELKGRITDTPQLMNLDKARELSSGPWLCSAAKARQSLGFAPQALSASLLQTAHWYRQQGWLPP